jgi:bifunctional isochorismate lyase / aryl carrier protein
MRTESYITDADREERVGSWLAKIRKETAPRPRLRLDPARCALLVVDANRYFADPAGACYLPAASAAVPRIAELLSAWRALGSTVAFTRHGHEGERDAGMLGRFFGGFLDARDPEAEIVERLAPLEDEPIVGKTTYDAFLSTPLESILRDREIEQVLIGGVLTHMCCETTARSAFCRGFEVYVAADATASRNEELHVSSLRSMADAVAVVLSVDEVLESCARRRS